MIIIRENEKMIRKVSDIAYKNGEDKIEMIFNPFDSIEINKKEPVFLLVEAMHSTGTSKDMVLEILEILQNMKM